LLALTTLYQAADDGSSASRVRAALNTPAAANLDSHGPILLADPRILP
jgi:hypothetical protein